MLPTNASSRLSHNPFGVDWFDCGLTQGSFPRCGTTLGFEPESLWDWESSKPIFISCSQRDGLSQAGITA
jgi:hypothetical protein